MLRWTAPSRRALDTLLERGRDAELTYPEVGATQADTLPDGYAHDRYRIELGPHTFDLAAEGLRTWQAHIGAGVAVHPDDSPLQLGTDVLVVARVGFVHAVAPCRVVYLVDEADRFGFAYGTLPGHPERGEEAFVVERAGDATSFSIVAFSRPAVLLARVGHPVARRIQRRVTRAYLEALRRHAAPQH